MKIRLFPRSGTARSLASATHRGKLGIDLDCEAAEEGQENTEKLVAILFSLVRSGQVDEVYCIFISPLFIFSFRHLNWLARREPRPCVCCSTSTLSHSIRPCLPVMMSPHSPSARTISFFCIPLSNASFLRYALNF